MKFLVDECLSIALVDMAVEAGHVESAHVTRRGMKGWKDHQLMQAIIDDDWRFVTRNSDDFRPRRGSTSQAPCYVGQSLHAGLVCLNLPTGSGRVGQMEYFQTAMDETGNPGDLVNKVLEVDPSSANVEQAVLRIHNFPEDDS